MVSLNYRTFIKNPTNSSSYQKKKSFSSSWTGVRETKGLDDIVLDASTTEQFGKIIIYCIILGNLRLRVSEVFKDKFTLNAVRTCGEATVNVDFSIFIVKLNYVFQDKNFKDNELKKICINLSIKVVNEKNFHFI